MGVVTSVKAGGGVYPQVSVMHLTETLTRAPFRYISNGMNQNPTFSPAETARLSGVSTELQRNWRHRGLLPPVDGPRARFTLAEVATFYLMNAASVLGPIGEVRDGCENLSAALAPFALKIARGEHPPVPQMAGAVMPSGELEAFDSFQDAIDALERVGAETIRILPLASLAVPFARRVEALMQERSE
ncbi:MAG TPA: hypothetical protein DCX75_10115 [Brevundimonas sp.]|nr:hypothetical protein [Brevundimonas sp.]HAJ02514.1 hypothetical protein [Brevundimonas sp.]HAV50461.1 hypothetical protein [Brevundimonas sp.]